MLQSPIFIKSEETLLWLLSHTQQFPKSQCFVKSFPVSIPARWWNSPSSPNKVAESLCGDGIIHLHLGETGRDLKVTEDDGCSVIRILVVGS